MQCPLALLPLLAGLCVSATLPGQDYRWRGPGELTGIAPREDDQWQAWWEVSRDALLPPRDTASGPDAAIVLGDVVPALRLAIAEASDDCAAASLVALAKIARDEPVPGFFAEVVVPQLALSPRRALAATFAIGVAGLGDDEALQVLADLARAGDRPRSVRAAARTALGLVAAARPAAATKRTIATTLLVLAASDTGDAELAVPLAFALGSVRLAEDELAPVRAALLPMVRPAPTLVPPDPRIAAQALCALAAATDPGSTFAEELRALCRALLQPPRGAPRPSSVLRSSAALALGWLAPRRDDRALDADERRLLACWRQDDDPRTRRLAMLSLGRRSGDAVQRALLAAMPSTATKDERPWIAMALLLAATRTEPLRPDDSVAAQVRSTLRQQLDGTRDPTARAAFALALGFWRDSAADDGLASLLEQHRSRDEFAGALAFALALQRGADAAPMLDDLVQRSTRRPDVLRAAVGALALADPAHCGPRLLALLDGDVAAFRRRSVQGALAAALGATRDPALVPPLLAILADDRRDFDERTAAAIALGCLCDRQPRPWNADLAARANPFAGTLSLFDQRDGALCWW